MPWYGYVLTALATVVVVPYWTWVAVKIISIEKDLAELRTRQDGFKAECTERLKWLRGMHGKIDRVAEDTAEIKGLLKARVQS